MMGKLYLVPTPIGNLKDITLRALEVLQEVDLVLAEDTRTSSKLLKHYQISTPLRSFHMHNEHKQLQKIISLLAHQKIALISDAGTPAISDPGFLLTRACANNDLPFEVLPGATAFVPALVLSGLPCETFVFEGFLPPKKGRQTKLNELAGLNKTIVLYESPYKLLKTLNDLATFLGGDRPISISRELTKIYEETLRGSINEVLKHFSKYPPKGEFVLVIGRKSSEKE